MRRNGFSLIELLVVIAVLAVLVSLASVSLRAGKEYSRTIVCASNLKQITLAAHIYLQDQETLPYGFNDEMAYPPPGGFIGDASYDWHGWWWFHFLYDSLGSDLSQDGPLGCPSRFVLGSSTNRNILCGNYGANFSLCRVFEPFPQEEYQGTPIRPTVLRQPAKTALFFDSGYAWTTWHCAADGPVTEFPNLNRIDSFYIPGLSVNETRTISPDQVDDALGGRHPNKTVNVGFADGHQKREPASSLHLQRDESGRGYSPLIWTSRL